MKEVEVIEQEKLASDCVRRLVVRGVDLIKETRDELNLPVFLSR